MQKYHYHCCHIAPPAKTNKQNIKCKGKVMELIHAEPSTRQEAHVHIHIHVFGSVQVHFASSHGVRACPSAAEVVFQ